MNWIIKALAALIRPFYRIHECAIHGVQSQGALLYVDDIAKLNEMIVTVAANLCKQHKIELNQQVMESMGKMVGTELDDMKQYCLDTINNRLDGVILEGVNNED